jgi:hypothetical protein
LDEFNHKARVLGQKVDKSPGFSVNYKEVLLIEQAGSGTSHASGSGAAKYAE